MSVVCFPLQKKKRKRAVKVITEVEEWDDVNANEDKTNFILRKRHKVNPYFKPIYSSINISCFSGNDITEPQHTIQN